MAVVNSVAMNNHTFLFESYLYLGNALLGLIEIQC